MSGHNPSPSQKSNAGMQASFETVLRVATVIADANERLFKVQSDAANKAFAENSNHLRALLNTLNAKDPGKLLQEWSSLYQANMRRALEVTRTCFEIVPQTQAEIAKLVGEPFATANKETQQYLDQFTKAIGEGRDAAASTLKDFLAQAVVGATENGSAKKKKPA